MNIGISRFVLLSAALHLGLLGAVSFNRTMPPLLPSTLSVTLNEPSAATAASSKRAHAFTRPPLSRTTRVSAEKSTANALPTIPDAAKENDAQRTRLGDDDAATDIPSGQSPGLLSTPPSSESEDEGEEKPDIGQHPSDSDHQPHDAAATASQLAAQLRNALAPYFAYPSLARRNGWEGQVQIGLRVEADGRLSHVRVAHSSGFRILDSAALTTLGRINALPLAAGWLDGRHFDMVLPIEYRLIGG